MRQAVMTTTQDDQFKPTCESFCFLKSQTLP